MSLRLGLGYPELLWLYVTVPQAYPMPSVH